MLVTELIRRGAHWHGDRTAVASGDERMSFAEVDSLSGRLANVLLDSLGLAPGERIALLFDNSLLSLPLDFACIKAGLVRVPLNSRLSQAEHRAMMDSAGVRSLLFGASQAAQAMALKAALPGLAVHGVGAGDSDLLDLAREASDVAPDLRADPDAVILAVYTSGTTGKLKAAQHSHSSYCGVVNNILLNLVDPRPGNVMLHAASLIHASGTFVLPFWLRGGTAAVLTRFDPPEYLRAIERHRASALNMVPTMLQLLLDDPASAQTDMSSVETILYGASPMPRALIERALGMWGQKFVQYYGQTEAPLAMACLPREDHRLDQPERLLSCGRPAIDCEMKLVGEDGAEVAAGEAGEIAVRAPFTMAGYLDAPELDAATFLPGGWMRTRDVGRFDEAGYLYLIDRTSDMIVTGGYNVYPREVEDVLASHPAVREAAVVGIPDDKWVEAVTAFVTLRAEASEADLLAHAREQLAGYKVPKSVRVVDDIPKSAVGKPLRRKLRDPFWEGRERPI